MINFKNSFNILLFICLLISNNILITAQNVPKTILQFPDRIYNRDDGLASNNVFGVIQDSIGYLWFFTDRGISKFDGYTFKNFGLEEGLSDPTVWLLSSDSKGRLWIHTHDKKLLYIKDDSIHCAHKFSNELYIDFILENNKNQIIFKNADKKYFVFTESKQIIETFDKPEFDFECETKYFSCRFIGQQDEFYYALNENRDSLYIYEGCERRCISYMKSSKGLFHSPISNKKFMEISSARDLSIFKNGTKIRNYEFKNNISLNRSFEDRDGNVWACSKSEGVLFFKKTISGIDIIHTQYHDPFISCKTNENLILLGSQNGLLYNLDLKTNNISNLGLRPGFRNVIPFITNQSIVFGEFLPFAIDNNSKAITIADFGQRWNQLHLKESLPKISIKIGVDSILYSDHLGSLYLVSQSYKGIKSNKIYKDANRIKSWCYAFAKQIYVATKEEIIVLDSNLQFKRKIILNSNKDAVIPCELFFDSISNLLLIGTEGNGIYYLNNKDELKHIPITKGTFVNKIIKVGPYIISHVNNGIISIEHKTENLIINEFYCDEFGVLPENILNISNYQDTLYLICTNRIMKVRSYPKFYTATSINIHDFYLDEKLITNYECLSVPTKFKQISMKLTNLDYAKSKTYKYFFRIEKNQSFIELPNNELILTKVDPGLYDLEIISVNRYNGKTVSNRTLKLDIISPWWKSTLFILLVNILFLTLIFFGISIYFKQKRNIEQKIQELESDYKRIKLKALEAQMNPHFVYNCLASIQSYCFGPLKNQTRLRKNFCNYVHEKD